MKKNVLLFFLLLTTIPALAQQPDAILGNWLTSSGGGKVNIYKEGEKYFGRIVWLKNVNDENGKLRTDVKNPDQALRKRPITGIGILKNFLYNADEQVWEDGTVYDPKSGKTYSCRLSIKNNHLNMRGYIGISLLGRTETWTRAKK